jgi:hypothetical protein
MKREASLDIAAVNQGKIVCDFAGLPENAILASLAALRAKVMRRILLEPRVALADSGNAGLSSATPLVLLTVSRRPNE